MKTTALEATNNVIPLGVDPELLRHKPNRGNSPVAKAPPPASRQRFKVIPFPNAGGSQSWRVIGTNRQGKQIRENFSDENAAHCRQVELMADFLGRQADGSATRATSLSAEQLRIAEACFVRLDADDEMYLAVEHWLKDGKKNAVSESPRLDDAVKKFKEWLDEPSCTLRERTCGNLRNRVDIFSNGVANLPVNDFTPDMVEDFLIKQNVSPATRDNYRRALSRFFSWCIARPRRWTLVNPCREIRIEQEEKQPPSILSVEDCAKLLKASEPKGLAPYVAVCLFAGLRPFEASRLTWDAVNLKDREIRLEGTQTKTGRARVVAICDTLRAWLTAYEGQSFFPSSWRKKFDAVKLTAGFTGRIEEEQEQEEKNLKPWPVDVMRHTAISHYFRQTGSYGRAAEQFGNSEQIIKNHYQGRVSSDDTKKFYALRPKK